jgi:hypothetical protein
MFLLSSSRSIPLVMLCTAACAHPVTQRRERDLLPSRGHPPAGQRCVADSAPSTLPSVASLTDSALLSTLLVEFRARAEIDRAAALLSVRFGRDGRVRRSRVIETTLPDSLARRLEILVATALEAPGKGSVLAIRFAVMIDASPRVAVGRREFCPPAFQLARGEPASDAGDGVAGDNVALLPPSPAWVLQGVGRPPDPPLRSRTLPSEAVAAAETRAALAGGAGPQVVLRLLIDPAGRVEGVQPLSGFEYRELLERAMRWAWGQRFHPALDDGVAAQGAVTIRIR